MTSNARTAAPLTKRALYTRCCDGVATSDQLHDMYDKEREVTLRTFAKHVDIRPIAEAMGYEYGPRVKGLRLANDWAVRFYKSKFCGQPCYYMDHSAIDHIFLHTDQIALLASE
jgi:hypothetical protein